MYISSSLELELKQVGLEIPNPTYQNVIDWFRIHDCFINIIPINNDNKFKYNTTIEGNIILNYSCDTIYESEVLALESAFLHLIKFLKIKCEFFTR